MGDYGFKGAGEFSDTDFSEQNNMETDTLTVIVGRFQDETVCDVMNEFIQNQIECKDYVLIMVGLSAVISTKENPLDFETRKLMLQERYPEAHIQYIKDNRCNKVWSDNFDELVTKFAKKNNVDILNGVEVFGGQFTFIKDYTGEYPVEPLPEQVYINRDSEKRRISSSVKATSDFRAGVIWATQNQYPKVYPTVDVAVFDENRVLMAKKPGEDKLRFIGGFVDPRETFEDAAKREVMEEANIKIQNIEYRDTFVIDDWRYRGIDCITTTFFVADYKSGIPTPQDDIQSLRWVNIDELTNDMVVEEHIPLLINL